jgi:hypothetical protein
VLYKYVGHEDPNELIKILKFFIEDGTIRAPGHTTSMILPSSKPNLVFATIQEKLVRYHEMWPKEATVTVENWLKGQKTKETPICCAEICFWILV